MGSPKHAEKWCSLRKSWTTKELEDYILSLYPGIPLNLVGFNLGKASKTRKIEKVDFQSVSQLKKSVRRGKLFVIPKRTLMEPETSYQDDLPDISDHEMENEIENSEEVMSSSSYIMKGVAVRAVTVPKND
ncbi:uncharacterized protein LOC133172059 [Saccostrea echinata]|uniref:uncharacterized protein LOC133172059 n=1 Tax=Saccostrea echinata TaxID=191078 RepID=UPI002A82367F|nr:uncharacterized protein LOC133172059 [Saccostrea echinata]